MESEIHSVIPYTLTTKIRDCLSCDSLPLVQRQLRSRLTLRVDLNPVLNLKSLSYEHLNKGGSGTV